MFSQMSLYVLIYDHVFSINSYTGLAEIWFCLNGILAYRALCMQSAITFFVTQPHHVACLVWLYQYKLIAFV